MRKKRSYGYDINDPNDRAMMLDLDFNMLNRRGRKAKKKQLFK